MKCAGNIIAEWLDEHYRKSTDVDNPELYGPIDWMSYYDGAMAVLKIAGYNVEQVPCGRQMIHIVKSNAEK